MAGILLIEDDAAARHLLRALLERDSHTVWESASPDEAWTVLEERAAPDLAIVDAFHPIPLRSHVAPPTGKTVFAISHPAALPAYQYDGYTPRERHLLREHGISIRLVELADPAAVPDNPPPADLIQVADLHDGRDHRQP